MFDSLVKPVLCYASQVWGFCYVNTIETVHLDFCKRYLGLNKSTNNAVVLGECGRLPLCISYMSNCIKYWYKLLHMPNSRYPKQCYVMLKRQDESGRTNWASKVKELLFKYGFGFAWVSQEIENVPNFINIFRQRLIDNCSQEWHDSINTSSRYHHYKYFKSQLNVERYITLDMPYRFKKAFSKFRCFNNKLAIELGRHINIPVEQRTCNYCLTVKTLQSLTASFMHFFIVINTHKYVNSTYLVGMIKDLLLMIFIN